MRIKDIHSPYPFAFLAILFWSTISTAFKISLRYQTPEQLVMNASFISIVVLFLIILIQRNTSSLFSFTKREFTSSIILGSLNPFLYYTVLLNAYDRLPAQEAQALNYIWVVMLVLLSIPILKQKPNFFDLSGVVISFFGAVIIATRGHLTSLHFEQPLGVALALLSTVIWAFFWLFNVRDKRDEVVKLFWNFLFGFLFINIYLLCKGRWILPTSNALLSASYIGIFEMGLTFVLWLNALKRTKSTARVTNLIFITPFLSLMIISSVLHETIALSTIAGLVLIIGGILWQGLQKRLETRD
ncbi:MAG TPA: DMT family transporter [Candidatus Cloacimonadota bacterium]|nr:DMT family transporter [Candidatus Cloacimonadota bacterium]HPT72206.1 DMT family transporter [Candidatus Cloacimonadota bacterium]